jgi:hypothetical protein
MSAPARERSFGGRLKAGLNTWGFFFGRPTRTFGLEFLYFLLDPPISVFLFGATPEEERKMRR